MSRRFLRLWLLVTAAALAIQLGGYPLFDADEGRNAEVGREMAATNDYVMPRLDALPYLDKPVLYFAAEAAAMEVLGPTETAARLPAYLFTLMTAAVVFWFARRLWGEDDAYVAAIAFLAMPLTLAFARTVIFDSALTFFIVVATVAFFLAVEERPRWNLLAWTAIGFGVLTKGPVAILLPLLVAIPFAIRRKRFGALWSGLPLMLVVVAPWVWAVSREIPDFLRYVVVTETAQRLTTGALKRTGPPWYFIPYVIGGALPWSFAAASAWRRERSEDRETTRGAMLFVALWIVLPFVFFSLSQSKRPQYVLPLMPAIALAAARATGRNWIRVAAAVFLGLGLAILAVPYVHLKMKPEIAAGAASVSLPLGLAFLAGSAAPLFRRRDFAVAALTIPILAIPIAANPLMNAIGVRRSAKAFVTQLAPHAAGGTRVVAVESFTGSLAFYLRKPVTLVSPDGSELTSNYILRHYERFAGNPFSTLQRPEALRLERGTVYVLRNDDAAGRAAFETRGAIRIAEGAHHVAYTIR